MKLLRTLVCLFMAPGAWAFSIGQNATLELGVTSFTAANFGQIHGPGALYGPSGSTFDAAGNLWVADTQNSRVLEFAPPFSNGMNAVLVLGQPDFTSNGQTTSQNGLSSPAGLAFDGSGDLWVADTHNHRVLEFVPPFSNGMPASLLLGQQLNGYGYLNPAPAAPQMSSPGSLAFDAGGDLWVADSGNNRVLKFVPPFDPLNNPDVVLGQSDPVSGAAPAASQNGMAGPGSLAFDGSGNLWVSEVSNNRVLKFGPPFATGMNASLVLGQANFTSNTAATTRSGMNMPVGLAFDGSGDLWVADLFNKRVLEFDPAFVTGMNAALVLGQADFISNTPAISQNGLTDPAGVAFDASGNLWVADSANGRLLKFAPSFSNGMNASLELGESIWSNGSGDATPATMNPKASAFDASGDLWVADSNNSRVLEFVPPFSDGESASLVLGNSNFNSGSPGAQLK